MNSFAGDEREIALDRGRQAFIELAERLDGDNKTLTNSALALIKNFSEHIKRGISLDQALILAANSPAPVDGRGQSKKHKYATRNEALTKAFELLRVGFDSNPAIPKRWLRCNRLASDLNHYAQKKRKTGLFPLGTTEYHNLIVLICIESGSNPPATPVGVWKALQKTESCSK